MKRFSEQEYDLPELWFTGAQWTDGTAEFVYRKLYKAKRKELLHNPPVRQRKDYFDGWFAHSLDEDDWKL